MRRVAIILGHAVGGGCAVSVVVLLLAWPLSHVRKATLTKATVSSAGVVNHHGGFCIGKGSAWFWWDGDPTQRWRGRWRINVGKPTANTAWLSFKMSMDGPRFRNAIGSPHVMLSLGLLALLPAGPAAFWGVLVYRGQRYRSRLKRGCCTRCGYDLRGTMGGVCPECGHPRPTALAGLGAA